MKVAQPKGFALIFVMVLIVTFLEQVLFMGLAKRQLENIQFLSTERLS